MTKLTICAVINNSKIAQTSAKYTMHSTGKIESYLARVNDLEKVLVQKWLICIDDICNKKAQQSLTYPRDAV